MKTAITQLIEQLEEIKKNNCKTLQEVIFFDGVLAIIESKYPDIEKQQIIDAYDLGMGHYGDANRRADAEQYFNETFEQ